MDKGSVSDVRFSNMENADILGLNFVWSSMGF